MLSKIINHNNFPQQVFELEKIYGEMDLSEVFAIRRDSYLNEFTLFVAHFKAIPNFIHEINIDCKKANNWFLKHHKSEIKNCYYDKNTLTTV